MPTFAQALDLKNDPRLICEYVEHHRAVWPEVEAALRDIGIERMRIYLTGNRLFMTFDAAAGFEPSRDFQRFTATARGRAWDELMRRYQQRIPGAAAGEWWTPMTLVYALG